jgi:hypothetical protein
VTLIEEILEAGTALGKLVAEKNAAYGDSVAFSEFLMKELYPHGISPEQYKDALLIVRISDKLKRVANNKGAFEENPFLDIAGYGLRGSLL